MKHLPVHLLPLAALVLGSGCGAGSPAPGAYPGDPELATKYQRSCLGCHTAAVSGAPQTHDAAAWGPRLAKGMDALVARTRKGVGRMPAGGGCPDCSDADYAALIRFMARPAD